MGCDWAPPINRQFCLSSGLLWGADGAGVLTAYVPPGTQPLEPVAPLRHPTVLGVPDSNRWHKGYWCVKIGRRGGADTRELEDLVRSDDSSTHDALPGV